MQTKFKIKSKRKKYIYKRKTEHHLNTRDSIIQIRSLDPKSRATAAAATETETNEGEIEPAPEVGLGAGASAAMAEPMRAHTATRTTIRVDIEAAIVVKGILSVKQRMFFLFS